MIKVRMTEQEAAEFKDNLFFLEMLVEMEVMLTAQIGNPTVVHKRMEQAFRWFNTRLVVEIED